MKLLDSSWVDLGIRKHCGVRYKGGIVPEILGRSAIFAGVLYTAFVAWSLYGAVIPVETHMFRMVHLEFIFALGFLVYPISPRPARWSVWLDVGLAVLGVASIIYALFDLEHFIRRSTLPDPLDVFFGIAAILLLLELSRRPVDNTFTLVMVAPALVKVGVSVHVEHLLAFCFAVLSEVSPPVGLSPSAICCDHGGQSVRIDDAGLEILASGLPCAVLLLGNSRGRKFAHH